MTAFFFLGNVLNDATFGILLALVAGFVIYISFGEAYPNGCEGSMGTGPSYGNFGSVSWLMFVMAMTLLILQGIILLIFEREINFISSEIVFPYCFKSVSNIVCISLLHFNCNFPSILQ
ncbi:MAG: hypothetical protein MZU79_02085 [Anaerotruncus sp.]|nr:hypothetical protein [Anaerotruncus sp.]